MYSLISRKSLAIFLLLVSLSELCFAIDADAVKWHPGHYYTLMSWGKDNDTYMNEVYKELRNTSTLRGIQVRFTWYELETAEGVYNYSLIDKLLSNLKSINKHLVIQVQTKSFNSSDPLVPSYIRALAYDGGVFPYGAYGNAAIINGYNIKLWNKGVKDRLIALMQALGNRYNLQSNFEGIGFIETAFGQPLITVSTTQFNSFYYNLLEVNRQTRLAFPNTMSIQEVNYPHTILSEFIETNSNSLANSKTGLSCPDVFPDETGLTDPGRAYSYLNKYAGHLPIAPQVMQTNYEWTVKDKSDLSGHVPTIEELYLYAKDNLKANYIFWTRYDTDTNDKYLEVLAFLKSSTVSSDLSGAGNLNSNCPTAYAKCDKTSNLAPIIVSSITDQNFKETTNTNFTIPSGSFKDPEGSSLSYLAIQSNGSNLPTWLAFDSTTLTFSGVPPLNSPDVSVSLKIADDKGATTSEVFVIKTILPNLAPVVSSKLKDQTMIETKYSNFKIPLNSFSDPNGDILKYSVTQSNDSKLPAWLSVSQTQYDLVFSGIAPKGSSKFYIKVKATDPNGLSVADVFIIYTPTP